MTKVKFQNLLAVLLLFTAFSSQAQRLTCTTHSHTDEALAQNPERLALREQLRREIDEYLATEDPTRGGEPDVRVIPTVFHVIHDNGSENLSKQTLLNALEAVNLELRGQNNSVSTVVPPFNNNIGDSYHELRLAKIDVNGNCTDGITRTVSDQTYSAGEGVKDLVNWNTGTRRYLQVWVVNTVGSGAGGYTYLPGSVSAYRNGIILRAAQFQSSLTHEFGHWLNLAHTWGPTNENAVGSNCSFDDGISDTPNTIGSEQVCNVNQESCGSLDNVQNHMDYSSCARMFTGGQANEMYAASSSSVGGRDYYWTSTNRNQTGTNDGFTPQPCVPNVEFAFEDAVGCEGLEVQFEDNSWGADEDATWEWNWNFPGGTPSSSNAENPTVTYNTGGVYDVSLTITTGAGSDTYTVSDAIVVEAVGGGIDAVYQEGMENADFPDNSDPSLEWSIESPGGLTWQRTQSASFTGSASARINLRSISTGNENNLISPPIDMSDVEPANARMYFRLAHANRTSDDHNEQLRVYVSRDCGTNWTLRYTESGDDLNTAGANVSGTFVPNENQWREESVSLASVAGDEHVLIRFEATSDRQSYLYIDDININPNHVGIEEIETLASANIYPNPIDGTSQLELRLTEADEFTFKLVNVLGKEIATFGRNLNVGSNRISLSEFGTNLNAGFYFIQMTTESGQKSIRFVKN